MEHYCREGKRVLLVAPKSIMVSSWEGYLKEYLKQYRKPFGTLCEVYMTELGFDFVGDADETTTAKLQDKRDLVDSLIEQADVIVVDESHNFRASNASRYKNLMRIAAPSMGRKKVILLTATPINTAYRDISNQLALVTHDNGNIGGYNIEQIKRHANELDRDKPADNPSGQISMTLEDTPSGVLNRVLESVVIQRSRATVRALAEAKGKVVHFPTRTAPRCIEVSIKAQSGLTRDLIKLAEQRFQPTATYIKLIEAEIEKARKAGRPLTTVKIPKAQPKGIKLAAFLTEQYRHVPAVGQKTYLDEVHLAKLVFANALKQLESSPGRPFRASCKVWAWA